jgi:hypothetical protein
MSKWVFLVFYPILPILFIHPTEIQVEVIFPQHSEPNALSIIFLHELPLSGPHLSNLEVFEYFFSSQSGRSCFLLGKLGGGLLCRIVPLRQDLALFLVNKE